MSAIRAARMLAYAMLTAAVVLLYGLVAGIYAYVALEQAEERGAAEAMAERAGR